MKVIPSGQGYTVQIVDARCVYYQTFVDKFDSEMDGYSGDDEVFRKTLRFEIIAKNLN